MPQRRDVKAPEKVDIQMTPMIDIVFQLMAFFLMTFKVASVEGDFNLKLPKAERSAGAANTQSEMLTIKLRSTANGELASLQIQGSGPINGKAVPSPYRQLRNFVEIKVSQARSAGQEEPEIQIDADDLLRYSNIIDTIEAVSATRGPNGEFQQLAKKVKFAPRAE
jgi:biopolymer transport protein ExbD